MTDLEAIVDQAVLLKPGDIVAITFRHEVPPESEERIRDILTAVEKKVGVKFVLFEDCDLTVLRPVEDA